MTCENCAGGGIFSRSDTRSNVDKHKRLNKEKTRTRGEFNMEKLLLQLSELEVVTNAKNLPFGGDE